MKEPTNCKEVVLLYLELEGNRVSQNFGNGKETIAVISDILVRYPAVAEILIKNGKRRAKRGKK